MASIEIDGTTIAYDVAGEGPPWVLTPGGRFSRDTPGIRELAAALAEHGQSVLVWDRPNTGESDVCFTGASESDMQADKLAGLLTALDMAPAIVVGGSGGSRVSLLTAANHPEVAAGLGMLWISGGVYGLMLLGVHYCGESLRAAWTGGMEAVVALPEWAEVLERNPRNRDLFLALDPRQFVDTMERWMLVYCPRAGSTVPGITDERLSQLAVPTLVFRSGASDPHHTRATSDRLAEVIPGARREDPPWGDREWIERGESAAAGHGGLFSGWPQLAPQLLEFAERVRGG
jgi:pimeloyl-ACP methyl ester carboxylesterase